MSTDTSEKGLETLIMRHMTGTDGLAVAPSIMARPPMPYGGTGYFAGAPATTTVPMHSMCRSFSPSCA